MDDILHQAWLLGLAKLIKAELLPEYDLNTVLAYGFPPGTERCRGVCLFPPPTPANEKPRPVIFISPAEWVSPNAVIRTAIHEMIHTLIDKKDGDHGPLFIERAASVGLYGALYDEPDAGLRARIEAMVGVLPPMPRDPMVDLRTGSQADSQTDSTTPPTKASAPARTQKCRMLLWECSCATKIRHAKKDLMAMCLRCGSDFKLMGGKES